MDLIFHEKQEGSLCAQHCLNSLLQGPYFNAVDLADIARKLDEEERIRMAEGDLESVEYQNFLQEPSSNMDDSGYFSIQVICKALEVWNLEMIPFNSPAAKKAQDQPIAECAYICNQQNHWLTIRKLGTQWFNLNSVKAYPELISDTYLSLLLAQLKVEGYSIFVIRGSMPESVAAQVLSLHPLSSDDYKRFVEFQRAKSTLKKNSTGRNTYKDVIEVDDCSTTAVNSSDVRDKRLHYFNQKQGHPSKNDVCDKENEMIEEEMLKAAMEMSMEQ